MLYVHMTKYHEEINISSFADGPNIKCYGDSVSFNVNEQHEFLTNATKITVRHQDATTTKCSFPLSHPFTDAIKFNFDACKLTRTAIVRFCVLYIVLK
jgi:hypothetical protein